MNRLLLALLSAVCLLGTTAHAEEKQQELLVGEGHYVVLPVKGKIKRVALGNENTAHVTVLQDDEAAKDKPRPKIIEVKHR